MAQFFTGDWGSFEIRGGAWSEDRPLVIRAADPVHWGSLGAALLTLFQMLTLEGWVEIQAAAMTAHPWAWLYFGSFVLVAVFVVVNLFIAVVLNNLETVKHEQQLEANRGSGHHELLDTIEALRQQLAELEGRLHAAPPQPVDAPAAPRSAVQ